MFKKTSLLIIVILLKFTDIDAKRPKNNGTRVSLEEVNRWGAVGTLIVDAYRLTRDDKNCFIRNKESNFTRALRKQREKQKERQALKDRAENRRYAALSIWQKLFSCCMRRRTK